LGSIARLQLDRITTRIRDSHNVAFSYDGAVVDHIVSQCNTPDSGARMIDNIITNTLLPALSREFLKRSINNAPLKSAKVSIENGGLSYAWQ
jgi:type VI secretion system protein VasG